MSECRATVFSAESLGGPFTDPSRETPYRIADRRGVYVAHWRGRPERLYPAPENQNAAYATQQRGYDPPEKGPWAFNYAVRRSPCMLVSGDLPRFALVATREEAKPNPLLHRLGDARLRITHGPYRFWLDERGTIRTRYDPWGTEHEIDLRPEVPATLRIEATLIENHGLGLRVEARVEDEADEPVHLELVYGGLDVEGPRRWVEYIRPHPQGHPWHQPRTAIKADRVALEDSGVARISNDAHEVIFAASAACTGAGEPTVEEDHDFLPPRRARWALEVAPGTDSGPVRFLATRDDLANGDPDPNALDARFEESRAHDERVREGLEIETPDAVLDAGFHASVINLDYAYHPPAWFEGIHGWNGYFSDNWQISAATALRQDERAAAALRFFGESEKGPGGVFCADGSASDTLNGIMYYVIQLHRHVRATGDLETLKRVWRPTVTNFEALWGHRDPDGDGLWNWHKGCNVFLYQADHLSLPGAALAPSAMAARLLEILAELGELIGESSQRLEGYRAEAQRTREAIENRLWVPEWQRYASAIDDDGFVQRAAHYTDFVFPLLYGDLDPARCASCLEALGRELWVGDHLLRTGSYKPDFFGSNAVHGTAMTEGAEAYFAAGRADEGWALLHGSARSATLYTDSPGAFPEFCSHSGWGVPHYIFGNDAAAHALATVSGLFGIERRASGEPILWHPALPPQWGHARLRLGSIAVSIEGAHGARRYRIGLDEAQGAVVRLPLFGDRVESVTDGAGKALSWAEERVAERSFARIELEPSEEHVVVLHTSRASPEDAGEAIPPRPVAAPPRVESARSAEEPWRVKKLAGPAVPLPLEGLFDAERLDVPFNWQHTGVFDFGDEVDPAGRFAIGPYRFAVARNGRNFVRLERGYYTTEVDRIVPSDHGRALTVPVQRQGRGIELLFTGSGAPRLTDVAVGSVALRYAEGPPTRASLMFAENLESAWWAPTGPLHAKALPHDRVTEFPNHVLAMTVEADPARTIAEARLRIDAVDVSLALFAMNVVPAQGAENRETARR